jgi:hypothetical protein
MKIRSELRILFLLVGLATTTSFASAAVFNFFEGPNNEGPFAVSTNMFDTVITINAHGVSFDGIHNSSISEFPLFGGPYIGGLLADPGIVTDLVILTPGGVYFPPSGAFQPIHIDVVTDDQPLTEVIATYGVSANNFLIQDRSYGSLQDISDVMGSLVGGGEGIRIRMGVPEPGTLALLGVGLAGLGFSRRRKLEQAVHTLTERLG